MWVSYTTYMLRDAFDTWNAGAWVIAALMVYGVWRLWRGMRPDTFQRGLRALRERRQRTISFPRRQAPAARTGLLQISLLPLMLVSCALAMLLAQAQRPDEVSRPVTWALFVGAGVWYGTAMWRRHRGVGPLRNYAFAGVVSGVAVSALLWGFYLVVDSWSGGRIVGRLTASFPVLLWWTALGGVVGALVGAFRANRVYGQARAAGDTASDSPSLDTGDDGLTVKASPRTRKIQWGAVAVACCASALFHLSAAPHLVREVRVRYWAWHWNWDRYHRPGNEIIVTMATSDSVLDGHVDSFQLSDFGDVDVDDSQMLEVDFVIGDSYAPGTTGRTVAAPKRDIAVGQRITGDMLTVTSYPLGGSDWAVDPESLIGKYANQRLLAGRPIAAAQVSDRRNRQLGRLGAAPGQGDPSMGGGVSAATVPPTRFRVSYRDPLGRATLAGAATAEDGSDPSNVDVLTGPTPLVDAVPYDSQTVVAPQSSQPEPQASAYPTPALPGNAVPSASSPGASPWAGKLRRLLVTVRTADGRVLRGYAAGTTVDSLLLHDVLALETATQLVSIQRDKIMSISADSVTVLTKDGKVLTGFFASPSIEDWAEGLLNLRTADGVVAVPMSQVESVKTVQGGAAVLPSPVFPPGQGPTDAPTDDSDSTPTEPIPMAQ